jgi:hypothetical protein
MMATQLFLYKMDKEIIPDETISMAEQMLQILEGVDCLVDLFSDHIERLKLLSDGPMVIDKFETSLEEFDYWSSRAGNGVKDVGLVA